jgi:hypothetical protein
MKIDYILWGTALVFCLISALSALNAVIRPAITQEDIRAALQAWRAPADPGLQAITENNVFIAAVEPGTDPALFVPSALTDRGMRLRAAAWNKDRERYIGNGGIAIVFFAGSIFCACRLVRQQGEEGEV